MQLGVQVVVSDPRELKKIRQREANMTKERIEKLLKAGANVVLTTKGIDDMALKIGFYYGNLEVTSGGIALKFFASVWLEVCPIGKIKSAKGDEKIGLKVREECKRARYKGRTK